MCLLVVQAAPFNVFFWILFSKNPVFAQVAKLFHRHVRWILNGFRNAIEEDRLIPIKYGDGEAVAQGFHPIHVGIVVVITMVIGGSTPPAGPLLVVASAIGNEPYWKTSIEALPLILGQFAIVFLLIFFPDIIIFLPKFMGMLS